MQAGADGRVGRVVLLICSDDGDPFNATKAAQAGRQFNIAPDGSIRQRRLRQFHGDGGL